MALPFPARPTQLDENWFPEREVWDVAVETRIQALEETTGVPGIVFDYDEATMAIGTEEGLAYVQETEPSGNYGAWAYEWGAMAIGSDKTHATGYVSLAIGAGGAEADEAGAMAIGYSAESHAEDSLALGSNARNYSPDPDNVSDSAIAIGYRAETYATYTIAIGANTTVEAESGIVVGRAATVFTEGGIAIGEDVVVANGTFAVGYRARAFSIGSIGIGRAAVSHAPYSTVLGYAQQTTVNTIRERAIHMARDLEVRRPSTYTGEPVPTYSPTDNSTGVILASPNNTRYRVEVSDAGVLSVAALGSYDAFDWTMNTMAGYSAGECIAGSDDMATLVAGGVFGDIRTSTDSGATWTARSVSGAGPYNSWQDVAASADGTKMVLAGYTSTYLYTSANSGATWTARSAPGYGPWSSVAMSADGSKIYAASAFLFDKFWKSADGGVTWTKLSNTVALPRQLVNYVACSSDGLTVYACSRGGETEGYVSEIWGSDDGGVTWANIDFYWNGSPGATGFDGISCNGAGDVAVAWNGNDRNFVIGSLDYFDEYADYGYAFTRIKMARDGTYAISCTDDGHLMWSDSDAEDWDYINGSGMTPGISGWRDVAIGADATKVIAINSGSNCYTRTYTL